MLSSIHPLGERGRRNHFSTTATAFMLGSAVGGAFTGLLLGSIGAVVNLVPIVAGERRRLVAVAVVSVIAVFFDLSGRALPSVRRQVNEDWMGAFRGWVYGAGFGFQLGAGITTYITSAAVLLWLFTMVAVGSIPAAVLIGVTFGAVRGSSILFARSITTPDRLVDFHRRLHASVPRIRLATRAALIILAVATAGLALTGAP